MRYSLIGSPSARRVVSTVKRRKRLTRVEFRKHVDARILSSSACTASMETAPSVWSSPMDSLLHLHLVVRTSFCRFGSWGEASGCNHLAIKRPALLNAVQDMFMYQYVTVSYLMILD